VRGLQRDSTRNGKIPFTVQPRLTISRPRRHSLSISEFPHGMQLPSLLIHQNARLVHAKMALETRCWTTASNFYYPLSIHCHFGRNSPPPLP